VRAVGSIWRGVSAQRRIAARMPMLAERDVAGRRVVLGFGLLLPGHPRVCLPLASAPIWWLFAITARLVAIGPAWLGWRRAGAFLA
jgi:hypothetical protein